MKSLKIAFAVFVLTLAFGLSVSADTFYVDSAAAKGDGTKERPFSTISEAAAAVNPGDTVIVNPGIYYESVDITRAGTKEKPIVIRAADSGLGKTVITSADRNIREKKTAWTLEDEELQLYSVPFPYQMTRVLCNNANLMAYRGLDWLKKFVAAGSPGTSDYMLGGEHGYYYEPSEKKLYVRLNPKYCLNGDTNPNNNLMCVGGPEYIANRPEIGSKEHYNLGVIIEDKPAYVVIYGFTFETPGSAGVYVRSSNVTISNCWFRGCQAGVKGCGRTYKDVFDSHDVTVEYCDYTNFPYYEDGMEIVDKHADELLKVGAYYIMTWQAKGDTRGRIDFEEGGLITNAGNRWTIRHNKNTSTQDGMSYQWSFTHNAVSGDATQSFFSSGHKVYNNLIANCADNAIEFEDGLYDSEFHHNLIVNGMLGSISWQPAMSMRYPTNIKFHNNIIYNEYEDARLLCDEMKHYSTFFKVGVGINRSLNKRYGYSFGKDGFYYYDDWRSYDPKGIRRPTDKGLQFYNNTVVFPLSEFQTFNGAHYGGPADDANMHFTNNIFNVMVGMTDEQEKLHNGINDKFEPGHLLRGDSIDKYDCRTNLIIPYNDGTNPKVAGNGDGLLDNGGFTLDSLEQAGILTKKNADGLLTFVLSENSPLRGRGTQIDWEASDTTDLGAVPYGEDFITVYGPYNYGDVNCDGKIDALDVALVSSRLGTVPNSENQDMSNRCDLNFNGIIDEEDIRLVSAEVVKGVSAK